MNDKTLWWNDLQKRQIQKFRVQVYNSPIWKQARRVVLNENPFCVHCTSKGRTVEAVDIDHIIDLTSIFLSGDYDKCFDLDNLQGLCKQCHGAKTRKQHSKTNKK